MNDARVDVKVSSDRTYIHPKLGELRLRETSKGGEKLCKVFYDRPGGSWCAVDTIDYPEFEPLKTVQSMENYLDTLVREGKLALEIHTHQEGTVVGKTYPCPHCKHPNREPGGFCSWCKAPMDDETKAKAEDFARNNAGGITLLRADQIEPWEENSRKVFDPERLDELAESIRELGLVEPIIVRHQPGWLTLHSDDQKYTIIAGERRWRACKLAGVTAIPCVVRDDASSDLYALELGIVENLLRENLNPIEQARGWKRLVELGRTQEEIGARFGIKQATVSNAIRLLELPEHIQDAIELGEITPGHGKALLTWKRWPGILAIQFGRAKKGATTKELEKIGNTWDFTRVNLLVEMGRWNTSFDSEDICLACHDRKGKLCFNPQCHAEHNQAAKEAETAQIREQAKAAAGNEPNPGSTDDIPEPMLVADIPQSGMEIRWLTEENAARFGCPSDCPARSRLYDIDGFRPACTNGACFDEHVQLVREAEKVEKSRLLDEKLVQARDMIEKGLTHDMYDGKLFGRLIAYFVLAQESLEDYAEIFSRYGIDLGDPESWDDTNVEQVSDALAAYPPALLLAAAADRLVTEEIDYGKKGYRSGTRFTDWLLEKPTKKESAGSCSGDCGSCQLEECAK